MIAPTADALRERLGPALTGATQARDMLVLTLPAPAFLATVRDLKSGFGFDLLLDVTAIDWIGQAPRFEVVYHFYSTIHFTRVRLKVRVPEADPSVDSLAALYGSAAFMERECHDMYGIEFRGNADMRPILLYEGFVGHPLRKDYDKLREQPLVPYRK